MVLFEKYRQLINKADKVWGYYYDNNRTSPKYEKLGIIYHKILNIIHKLLNK